MSKKYTYYVYTNGLYRLDREIWFNNTKMRHCEDGPAYILYDKYEKVSGKYYFWSDHDITDFVKNLFSNIPDELNKEQQVLLKLNMPVEYFNND